MANVRADLKKTRGLSEESCNVTSAIHEYCKAPAKVHLTIVVIMPGERDLAPR